MLDATLRRMPSSFGILDQIDVDKHCTLMTVLRKTIKTSQQFVQPSAQRWSRGPAGLCPTGLADFRTKQTVPKLVAFVERHRAVGVAAGWGSLGSAWPKIPC